MLRLTYAKPLSHNPTPLLRCITVVDAESVETRNKELVCKKTALTRTKQKKRSARASRLDCSTFSACQQKMAATAMPLLILRTVPILPFLHGSNDVYLVYATEAYTALAGNFALLPFYRCKD